ncbi:MAG: CCA tRNA nucleotidyltransferase [Candidatus Omnitrophica bacterium]|nr:CCA tRNA nucleotidyltransferase [Candidatus Omnitrophota bacterium]
MSHSALRVDVPAGVKPLLQAIGRIAEAHAVRAYAVGGCVRDWLLGSTGTVDLDVAVEGRNSLEVARAVSRVLGGVVTVHPQFRTATVMLPSSRSGSRRTRQSAMRVDVAMCRRETYAKPAAYPTVMPGTLREDLFRRDFTINAMAIRMTPGRFGALIDPFGGREDLRRNELRVLHGRSFLDDPSRILRGVRLLERFDLRWARETERVLYEAIAAGALGWLNAGRLQRELEWMDDEPHPQACFQRLALLLKTAAQQGPAAMPGNPV